MKRLIFALSLVFLVGLFALSGSTTRTHAYNISSDQTQLTAQGAYQTVAWHRYWRDDDRDFDRPNVRYYYYDDYYDPYYYPYPYTYYYGPGFSINTPFFGINIP